MSKEKELEELREKILNYRAEHNISMLEFAKICNLTQQTIHNIEKGTQDPSRLTKRKILNVIERKEV